MTPDTREEFQTTEKATLDDYGIIAKINKRNRMRALNLMNGKYLGNGNKNGVSESLDERMFGFDPEEERMFDEVVLTAENEGNYYNKKDPAGAVDYAIKLYIKNMNDNMRSSARTIRKEAIKEVTKSWKGMSEGIDSLDEALDKSTLKKIAKMTDNNYHTKALIAGANLIGEKKLVKRLELVDKLHDLEGHLTDGLYQYRYELHKELKKLAEKKLSKEDFEALISCF